jgi:hypothetical protein
MKRLHRRGMVRNGGGSVWMIGTLRFRLDGSGPYIPPLLSAYSHRVNNKTIASFRNLSIRQKKQKNREKYSQFDKKPSIILCKKRNLPANKKDKDAIIFHTLRMFYTLLVDV